MSNRAREFLKWATDVFGPIAVNREERLARFVEESIELAHADEWLRRHNAKVKEGIAL